MLHARELRQEALTLLAVAEAIDHPRRHVVDRNIGGGRDAAGCELLEDQRGVKPLQPAAADILAHIDAGKAERRRSAQGVDREKTLLIPTCGMRQEFALRKVARHFLDRALLLAQLEIHASPPLRLARHA